MGFLNGSPVAFAFAVLAGVAGVFIVLALVRCGWSWRRTPARDRIETVVDRHTLEREMAEIERRDLARRVRVARRLTPPPPPPYQHAPDYDAAVEGPPPPPAPVAAPPRAVRRSPHRRCCRHPRNRPCPCPRHRRRS